MALKSINVDRQNKTLTIVMDLDTPRPSKSGLTLVVASTRGNCTTEALVDGKPITLGLNAYIKP